MGKLGGAPSYESLTEHLSAAKRGLDIERVIILGIDDVSELLNPQTNDKKDDLKILCDKVAELAKLAEKAEGHFKTFLARQEDLDYFANMTATSRPAAVADISIGNIALFTKGTGYKGATERNSISFYFVFKKINNRKIARACLSKRSEKIDFIRQCVSTLWEEKARFINCKEIQEMYHLARFLDIGRRSVNG